MGAPHSSSPHQSYRGEHGLVVNRPETHSEHEVELGVASPKLSSAVLCARCNPVTRLTALLPCLGLGRMRTATPRTRGRVRHVSPFRHRHSLSWKRTYAQSYCEGRGLHCELLDIC